MKNGNFHKMQKPTDEINIPNSFNFAPSRDHYQTLQGKNKKVMAENCYLINYKNKL